MPAVMHENVPVTDTYRREPLLTAEQERYYITRVQLHRDIDAQEHLVRSNIGWVVEIAKRWIRPGIEFDDLLQEGCIGLLKAVDHFDLTSTFRLTTYAGWWIRQRMERYVMNTSHPIRLPVYLHPVLHALKQDEARGTDTTTAAYDVEQIALVQQATQTVHSLDALFSQRTSDDLTLADLLADDGPAVEECAIAPVFQQELERVLSQVLTEREQHVLSLRYGLQNQEEHTLEHIGAVESVTRERIRQIERAAFEKLRRSPLVRELYVGLQQEGEL